MARIAYLKIAYLVTLIALIALGGCASRPQTCPPKDTRCQVLLYISTIDIGPKK